MVGVRRAIPDSRRVRQGGPICSTSLVAAYPLSVQPARVPFGTVPFGTVSSGTFVPQFSTGRPTVLACRSAYVVTPYCTCQYWDAR
eukprot:2755334-Rhodomonas_salina.2